MWSLSLSQNILLYWAHLSSWDDAPQKEGDEVSEWRQYGDVSDRKGDVTQALRQRDSRSDNQGGYRVSVGGANTVLSLPTEARVTAARGGAGLARFQLLSMAGNLKLGCLFLELPLKYIWNGWKQNCR